MINVAQIRAAAKAVDGDIVGITKAQLDDLLGEIEAGRTPRAPKAFETETGAPR